MADTFIGTVGYMSPERITGGYGGERMMDDPYTHNPHTNTHPPTMRISPNNIPPPPPSTGQGYSFGADIWAFGLSILACALGAFPLEESTHEPEGGGYWGLVHAVCESPSPALPDKFTPAFRSFVGRCVRYCGVV